ncbi:histidine phosphatase family protein [Streptomyces sp. ASQP_92]|uniref:histidine phosphatase family protein n=1 Tax=Streptomyces sp. ASQP_92 TaxID=2979116 RepID=UPI0021BE0C0B|nr:histidine phosphatase family protein [Streptomyces sp. ASQP_92]MCT9089830.1 histidine phosphatase family protein [Streptomyces sp. ASQP_92]
MKRTAPLSAAVAVSLTASLLFTSGTASASQRQGGSHTERDLYGTKAPYMPQGSPDGYQRAPKGFVPVFTENVARHGSRAMTDSADGDAVLALLRKGQDRGALTGLGARLGPQVQALLAAASTLGYGGLSARGVQEQRQTALRMERRLPSLFARIAARHEPVVVETSGVPRAVASADAFTAGLVAGDPALADLIGSPVTDKDLLYFHKQPQNADYQAYVKSDPQLAEVLTRIDGDPRTAEAAHRVVVRLFRADFVTALPTEEQVSFARALYQLYSAAPDLSVEAPTVDLTPFLDRRDARWFAYLDDAEEFYRKGPAFSGRTITYKMAGVLLDDLLAQAEAKAKGVRANGAVLRFTHAEEIEPLAALMGLPAGTAPAEPGRPYTYGNSQWRGAEVSPMAANIQWDLFANKPSKDRPASYLVRMLYNEKETAFRWSCEPVAKHSYFYELDELKRCLAHS